MPRFFFHVRDRHLTFFDNQGSELLNLDTALAEASACAQAIVEESQQRGVVEPDRWFEIVDEAGVALATVRFRDFLRRSFQNWRASRPATRNMQAA